MIVVISEVEMSDLEHRSAPIATILSERTNGENIIFYKYKELLERLQIIFTRNALIYQRPLDAFGRLK